MNNDQDYKRKIIGLTQKALQEADLINRSDKASTGILKLANLFNNTPRKGLAAATGFALAVLAWSLNPFVRLIAKFLLSPIASILGFSLGALVMPSSQAEKLKRQLDELENRRKRELDDIEARIRNLEDPELIESHKQRSKAIASADFDRLQQLFRASWLEIESAKSNKDQR